MTGGILKRNEESVKGGGPTVCGKYGGTTRLLEMMIFGGLVL